MDTLAKVEASAGKRLLQALVTELKLQSPRFQTMNEDSQSEVLDRLRSQVDEAVRECVSEIAANKNESARVTIESVTFKDGVKIVLTGIATSGVHAVADECGSQALLVLCDPEVFVGDLDTVKPRLAIRATKPAKGGRMLHQSTNGAIKHSLGYKAASYMAYRNISKRNKKKRGLK